ncbi:SirA family protein [Alkaliphilus metalliredigens QYMF]|uniref:SirA family protein n=1 Tax=Alkaliphilus metalliredigens (strain QYMF) TaxID=293826 RepID=A6TJD0_ALKMQ|nr:sulfurtransferase TusA family protein [Alkaliphilus metalliredigens]ABR46298.1 SirA family protein [Alkaliphilus metalliredigens QYMF]
MIKLGDVESLEAYDSEVAYLASKVVAMYESLSPQLEITLEKEANIKVTPEESKVKDQEKDLLNIVDLKGVKCPMNFVKAKVALGKIASGEEIGFYLDDDAPINNVPKSVEGEGHQIVNIDREYTGYNLLIVKKK